ncbi:MAG: PilZ domain-containing protein [Armatimonadetes bacterium]|nr:PilZ domain-containing protein [Armatimonadota bacterium]
MGRSLWSLQSDGARVGSGCTLDLAMGGCRVRSDVDFEPGRDLFLTLQLENGGFVTLVARTIWRRRADDSPGWELGLRFLDVLEDESDRLKSWLLSESLREVISRN